jgi:Lon protease-like protein
MADALLPLFPLQLVLLPGAELPLHIFEDRYKQMIGEVIGSSSEFGVVQAGERGILNIGCTAAVEKVLERYEDGQLDILCRGLRRFEIILLNQERDYLRASVSMFDDDEDESGVPADLQRTAMAAYALLRSSQERDDTDFRDPRFSFRIASLVDDLTLRQTMLSLRSEKERLLQLTSFLPQYLARLKRKAHVKKVAPRNGHGMIRIGEREEE